MQAKHYILLFIIMGWLLIFRAFTLRDVREPLVITSDKEFCTLWKFVTAIFICTLVVYGWEAIPIQR